jgi:hypothetical protein
MLLLAYEYLPPIFDSQSHRLNLSKVLELGSLADQRFGKELLQESSTYLSDLRRSFHVQTILLQIQTGCALERFRLKNHSYPKSLSGLGVIPKDPISGELQIYRVSTNATSYLLYSVGEDGRDDDGIPPEADCPEGRRCRSDWVWFSEVQTGKK